MKFWNFALAGMVLIISSNANATVISLDWRVAGDNLITRDTGSGLDWLDLTETNNMSYDTVQGQLGVGGAFEGFRYATNAEVISMWANFGIDLSFPAGEPAVSGIDTRIETVASILGNNVGAVGQLGYLGTFGITSDSYTYVGASPNYIDRLGAYIASNKSYFWLETYSAIERDRNSLDTASYLVQTSVVPIPATVWLFGSGLIGLVSFAKPRKA